MMGESEENSILTLPEPVPGVPESPSAVLPEVPPEDAPTGEVSENLPGEVPGSRSGSLSGEAADDPGENTAKPARIAGGFGLCALPYVLACVAALFFSAGAVAAVLGADLSGEALTRFLIGSLVGGSRYVLPASVDGDGTVIPVPRDEHQTALAPSESEPEPQTADAVPLYPSSACDALSLNNETPYEPDMELLAALPHAIPPLDTLHEIYGPDEPTVLILPAPGTEGYRETQAAGYRTEEPSLGVIGVGEALADALEDAGIVTLHLTEAFDAADFNLAYDRSAAAIRAALAAHPSIAYILDLHRDSIELSDGTRVAPVCSVDGVDAAQLMFVVGTDWAGADHPDWADNLALAARLQLRIEADCPGLTRAINLRAASFNEQYTRGSLLIEVGSSDNTVAQARRSIPALAEALIGEIKGD